MTDSDSLVKGLKGLLKVAMADLTAQVEAGEAEWTRRLRAEYDRAFAKKRTGLSWSVWRASELDQAALDIEDSRYQAAAAARLLQRLDVQARELRLQEEEVRLRRQQKELKAPGDGTLLRWEVREGATVNAYQVAGEFAPAGPLLLEAEVDEYFASNVQVGQNAIIRREGYTDTLARGQVIFTSGKLSGKSILSEDNSQFEDLQVRRIKIRLEDSGRLLLGMKVEALIQTAKNTD